MLCIFLELLFFGVRMKIKSMANLYVLFGILILAISRPGTAQTVSSANSAGEPVSISGPWVWIRINPKDGTQRRNLFRLEQKGTVLSGSIEYPWGSGVSLAGGTIQGNQVYFRTADSPAPEYVGTLEGDHLRLTLKENGKSTPLELVRLPPGTPPYPPAPPLPEIQSLASNGLAKTPPMGWNAWNHFLSSIDDGIVRQVADAMVSSGMRDAGYVYVNIDDEWAGERDAHGNIQPNRNFPDMKALANYIHSRGLKLGLYSSPGPETCVGHHGSLGYEEQDAQSYAEWGVDYLKYDWCSAAFVYQDADMRAAYQKMGSALRKTGRPIVYSLCQYGRAEVQQWGQAAGGNLWRTTQDIDDNWESMFSNWKSQHLISQWNKPGGWNDPDMLEIGNGGMSAEEYRTHFSLWALLSAPLLAGNDPRSMEPATIAILTNKEVIAIDQDALAAPPRKVSGMAEIETWIKPLVGGDLTVLLLNPSEKALHTDLKWSDLGVRGTPSVRDLWQHRDVSAPEGHKLDIPPHGVRMLRLSGVVAAGTTAP